MKTNYKKINISSGLYFSVMLLSNKTNRTPAFHISSLMNEKITWFRSRTQIESVEAEKTTRALFFLFFQHFFQYFPDKLLEGNAIHFKTFSPDFPENIQCCGLYGCGLWTGSEDLHISVRPQLEIVSRITCHLWFIKITKNMRWPICHSISSYTLKLGLLLIRVNVSQIRTLLSRWVTIKQKLDHKYDSDQ